MSAFSVGDKVKCVRNDKASKLVVGRTYNITSVAVGITGSSSVCVDGNDSDWWYADRFELVTPPQPAESPDDWVILPLDHVLRFGVDQFLTSREVWTVVCGLNGSLVSSLEMKRARCRRKDLPPLPAAVHTGGPYVARSEYERVCGERDNAIAEAERIRDGAVQIAQARDRAIYDLNAVRATLEKREAEVANLRVDKSILMADLKNYEETTAAMNKRVLGGNPNDWPLVPVDPSCIPDGHRAVEVTDKVNGKTTVIDFSRVHTWDTGSMYVQLVVEPISLPPAPDALPRPEFPAWIRAGWWVAMDAGGFWYMSEDEPLASEPVLGSTADRGTWNPPNMDDIQLTHVVTASMKAVPCDRWREAKWQIE